MKMRRWNRRRRRRKKLCCFGADATSASKKETRLEFANFESYLTFFCTFYWVSTFYFLFFSFGEFPTLVLPNHSIKARQFRKHEKRKSRNRRRRRQKKATASATSPFVIRDFSSLIWRARLKRRRVWWKGERGGGGGEEGLLVYSDDTAENKCHFHKHFFCNICFTKKSL